MPDPIVVLKVTGQMFKEALENGVSGWPHFDGKWPLLSGVQLAFDPELPPGSRIKMSDIHTLNGDKLDPDREYTVAMKMFLAEGKDGYDCFGRVSKDKYVVSFENST